MIHVTYSDVRPCRQHKTVGIHFNGFNNQVSIRTSWLGQSISYSGCLSSEKKSSQNLWCSFSTTSQMAKIKKMIHSITIYFHFYLELFQKSFMS